MATRENKLEGLMKDIHELEDFIYVLIPVIDQNTPHLNVPAIEEDRLIVHLSNPVKLSAELESRLTSTVSIPGSFTLVPQGTPSQWQVTGNNATVIVICLKHELFTRTALEVFESDVQFGELMENVVVEDQLVYQIGRSIYQELIFPGSASNLFIDSLTLVLVVHLLRNYSVLSNKGKEVSGSLSEPVLRGVVNYII